ncbi:MAG: polyhydroxyalkanoate synthesis regulator DNA-binding domain-containing protein [Kofleriaceae bacterium]|jgi:polyhydroxyalkanoate synthesis repressor PhaR|nr:polyhydroxyalkanoate synthesis regulator DNA-binding domain-containing protein [Kofleriaceae bacterium]MBP9167851.1 polyhydroxyalkanoate synthesis regulator DNA-binding domain-containing protein [Kofleriaceae bacterium]MBP9859358.1 polyhydroxyalkanoate synthesis regulator DNA-binding domain-containing protein [Kofleriaceae bacterium]
MAEARVIKRYANRKLYDTQHSRYVTLDQISEMIRAGDEVKIVDNKTKEDLTSVTLAQIIFEEEKKQRSFMPLGAMRNIIQHGGEWFAEAQRRVSSVLPFKRDHDEPMPEDDDADLGDADSDGPRRRELVVLREFRHWVNEQQRALDEWQKRVDGKIRTAIGGISPFAGIHKDVRALAERIAELEAKLESMGDADKVE